MSNEKSENKENKELREKLLVNRKNGAHVAGKEALGRAEEFCAGYKDFLDAAKTERESVAEAVRLAEACGFVPFVKGTGYKPGDKVYQNNRDKTITLAVVGRQPVEQGVHIAAAHIDSPRLDLKPNPLYENESLAFLKTHYYGGIKKYQWTTVPLSLHGVVCKKDGTKVTVSIGEDEGEPKTCVTELLIHLSNEMMNKKASEVIPGENMNLLIGSYPYPGDEGSDSVKLNIMNILSEKYGITEADFVTAELEAVPAGKACDIGLDRSMIGAYGHDDRVCSYPSLKALLDLEVPEHAAVCCLADKEEIGSYGSTGLKARFLEFFIRDLAAGQGGDEREALQNSRCLSADVSAAYDPHYADAYEKRNSCFLNGGAVISKYLGGRGKGGSNDASAEYLAWCGKIFDDAGVLWQMGELGKVDAGGGGTVASYIAELGVDTLDLGVPVLSMHSPLEVVSKLDVYMAYKAIAAFYAVGGNINCQ